MGCLVLSKKSVPWAGNLRDYLPFFLQTKASCVCTCVPVFVCMPWYDAIYFSIPALSLLMPSRLRHQKMSSLLLHGKQTATRATEIWFPFWVCFSVPCSALCQSPALRVCRVEGRCQKVRLHSTRIKVSLGTWKSPTIKYRKDVAGAKSAYFSVLFLGKEGCWVRRG